MDEEIVMSDATCVRCKFYEASDGTCRINPPVRLPRKAMYGGPTESEPNRPYCKPDQSCCDFCCGN